MDKFTKTTSTDISSMHTVEEETPNTSKAGKVVAFIICLLLAVSFWVYVSETSTETYEKDFDDVTVIAISTNEKFNIQADSVDVVVTATKSQIADLSNEKIIVEIDASGITSSGEHSVEIKRVYIDGGAEIKAVAKVSSVNVVVTEK